MTRADAKKMWMGRGVNCPKCGKLVWRNWRGALQMHWARETCTDHDGRILGESNGICSGGVSAIDPQFEPPQEFIYMPAPAPQVVALPDYLVFPMDFVTRA